MKRICFILILLTAIFFPGCDLFKDQIDELYAEVDSLKVSDRNMRLRLEQLNSSLSTLQGLVSAMQSGRYIKSVVPISEENGKTGQLITLSNGETFTIMEGADGIDGTTPAFGVKRGNDNAYYWTLDGDYLKDPSGRLVRADGPTPLFDIREGVWFLSLDNGDTWLELGPAIGSDGQPGAPGDQIFASVDYTPGENIVTFVLSDGTSITLPCYQPISISFAVADNETSIAAGETVKVDYTLSYGDDNTVVTASSDGNYIVKVEEKDNTTGSILITCPGLYMDGHVNVMAFDGVGYATVAVITFYEKYLSIQNGLQYFVPTEGCTLDIPLHFNFDYTLTVAKEDESWISLLKTKASTQEGCIEAGIARNDGDPRTGRILLYADNAVGSPYATITISQDGAYFEIGESSFIFGSSGGDASVWIRTSKNIDIRVPDGASSWAKTSLSSTGSDQYSVSIAVSGNDTGMKRSTSIPILNASDEKTLATIEIMQLTGSGDNEMDMIFKVRASESNDYTVYLPVTPQDNEFTVDWGDGQYEQIDPETYSLEEALFHEYEGIIETGRIFTVTLSGTIRRLNSDPIPQGLRSGIVSVEQWGHTGLTDMRNAFRGNTSLTTLPADETLAFGEVSSFNGAFAECPSLVNISSRLFNHAFKATDFNEVFHYCLSLKTIPERLFSPCQSAYSFRNSFSHCTSIESLPGTLFSNCSKALYFSGAFNECHNLKTVPENLFSDCSEAKEFDNLFRQCRKLKTVPGGLFAHCTEATSFSVAFRECSELNVIPQDLFKHNTKVESFYESFGWCENLKSVPAHLFDSCESVWDIERIFGWCGQLENVPEDLFDHMRKITNFNWSFAGCHRMIGESPYTMVNGKRVHFYERADYPDYFVTPTFHDGCFSGCDQLTDIEDIPSDWR